MGLVSAAVLDGGGEVTGVVPDAMLLAGGERPAGQESEHGARVAVAVAVRRAVVTEFASSSCFHPTTTDLDCSCSTCVSGSKNRKAFGDDFHRLG